MENKITKLKKASEAYYEGKPTMSDAEFDILRDSLPEGTEFLTKIGTPPTGDLPKVKHIQRMGSLNKYKHDEKTKFLLWAKGKEPFNISEKLDGLTVILTYKDGKLIVGATRGDGMIGDDVTYNIIKMKNVEQKIAGFTGTLRAEAIISLSDFDTYFKPIPNRYKNPRNSAAGLIRDQKGNNLIKHIQLIYFDMVGDFKTETEKMNKIKSLGLKTVKNVGNKNAVKTWEFFKEHDRDSLNHEIDGLVVRSESLEIQKFLGVVDGRPKGQIAIKYQPKGSITTINNVVWQLGLSGHITPVAEITSIDVGGVTIKRCMLNNVDFIKELDIAIGDHVEIIRAGDVIPAVQRVIDRSSRTKEIEQPINCPECGVSIEMDGAFLVCPNLGCSGKIYGDLMTWVKTHDIKHLGKSHLKKLIAANIEDPADLHNLSEDEMGKIIGTGHAKRIFAYMKKMTKVSLSKFLTSLNIHRLGVTNGCRLESKFKTLSNTIKATTKEIAQIEGIGPDTAAIIKRGLDLNSNLIWKMTKIMKIVGKVDGVLANLSCAMTGLRVWDGQNIEDMIIVNGGTLKNGVSKELNILIIKDPASTSNKAKKAIKYGTKLISPDDFFTELKIAKAENRTFNV